MSRLATAIVAALFSAIPHPSWSGRDAETMVRREIPAALRPSFDAGRVAWSRETSRLCGGDAACGEARARLRRDALSALSARLSPANPPLDLRASWLEGEWRVHAHFPEDLPPPPGMPGQGLLRFAPGEFCSDQGCLPFSLEAAPRLSPSLRGVPEGGSAFLATSGRSMSFLLFPRPDGSLVAEGTSCRDGLRDCLAAGRVWIPGPGAALRSVGLGR